MLVTIIYNNREAATDQNYAKLSSGEQELSCRALKNSSTPRRTVAYQYEMSYILITIVYDN